MEHLTKLLGSPARVKLLRLFVFNPEIILDREAVLQKARITPDTASRELAALARAGVVARKNFYKEVVRPGGSKLKKRKTLGWTLNAKYPHLEALAEFLQNTLTISHKDLNKRFRGAGRVKLLIIAGALIGHKTHSLDMLIVGDALDEVVVKSVLRTLEAECGKEIRYALLPVEDYLYRRRVRDKLVRDITSNTHEVVVDRVLA